MKTFRPLLFFAALLLLVGLACQALSGGGGNPATQQPAEPTEPPAAPTESAPEPTAAPATEPPAPQAEQFFTEEFDNPLSSDWSVFTVTGSDKADADKVTVEAQNGKLVWDFQSEYVYYYLFYGAFQYQDVRLEVNAENKGRNNNSISLICRYDPKVGWYEFNIANNGLYNILYAEVTKSGKIAYNRITNGGSNAIKQGKEVNEYSITCIGQELSLSINGDDVNTITEKKYGLSEGGVGVSVSSFNVLPILIDMDWIKVSEP